MRRFSLILGFFFQIVPDNEADRDLEIDSLLEHMKDLIDDIDSLSDQHLRDEIRSVAGLSGEDVMGVIDTFSDQNLREEIRRVADLSGEMVPVKLPVFRAIRTWAQAERAGVFAELAEERDDFEVFYHDIGEEVHRDHFDQLTELENIPKSTPVILVGNTVLQGFMSGSTLGDGVRQGCDLHHRRAVKSSRKRFV